MKKLLILLLLATTPFTLVSQKNFSEGYIITNTNDTIFGKIDFRTPKINQEKCIFISNTKEQQTYLPGDIKAYGYSVASKFYITKDIFIKDKQHCLFAEYLVQGELNLFYIEEEAQNYFLFEEEGKEPLYITQQKEKMTNKRIHYDKKYIGLLLHYYRGCSPQMKKLIENAKFDQQSMIAIVKQYNDENCLNSEDISCVIFENKSPDQFGYQINFSIYTGLQVGTYDGYYYKGTNAFPSIGIQICVSNPRWSKSFGALADVSFSKIDKTSPKLKNTDFEGHNIVDYNMYTMGLKIGVRYTFSQYKLKPSIEGGGSTTIILKNNSTRSYDDDYTHRSDKLEVGKLHLGGYLGVGLEYNIAKTQSVFARFNYDFYAKSSQEVMKYTESINLWHIKIGYTF